MKTARPVFAPTVSFAMQPTYFSYPTGLHAPGADWEPKNFRLSALRELASLRANSRNEKSHRKLVRDSERESGCDRISWAKDKSFSALFTRPFSPSSSSCLVLSRLHLTSPPLHSLSLFHMTIVEASCFMITSILVTPRFMVILVCSV